MSIADLKELKRSNVNIYLIIGFVLFSSSICFAQTKGGRWIFENNGNDEAAWDDFDNNGSLSGTALFSFSGTNVQGEYSLSLEDSTNYGVFKVTDHDELDFNNENLALSLWVYPVKGFDNPQHIIMKGDRSGSVKTNNYALRINEEYLEFIVHSESGANKVAKSSFKVVQDEWNFMAVYYDYNNSKLYLWNDNELVPIDTFDFNAPLFPNNEKLFIGASGENGFKRLWGKVDDVRISNKVSDIIDNSTSTASSEMEGLPVNFSLSQNYPNPFNPETVIKFFLEENGFTRLNVYNLLGVEVAALINRELEIGEHEIRFNAGNLPSGIYLYQLQQGRNSILKKMILIK